MRLYPLLAGSLLLLLMSQGMPAIEPPSLSLLDHTTAVVQVAQVTSQIPHRGSGRRSVV